MKLLFFTQKIDASDDILGFTLDWVDALAKRVDRLECLALEVADHPDFPENVTLHSLGKERGKGRLGLVIESQKQLSTLSRRVDAVLVHMAPVYALLSYPFATMRGIPIFTWYTHEKVSLTLRAATAVSRRMFTAAPESFRLETDKLEVMGHGIPLHRFEAASKESAGLEVISIGRLSPIKRHEVLIEAASVLKERASPLRFRIVGEAGIDANRPYAAGLRRRVEERGLGEVVVFEGRVPYREVPSRYEGALCGVSACAANFDKVVLECMAAGKPSFTANSAFKPLLGDDAELLVFPPDDAKGLAERLQHLVEMPPEERRALGARLRAAVTREHSLDSLMDRIVARIAAEVSMTPMASRARTP